MSQLSISKELKAALAPLVGQRVYARTFMQPSGQLPEWPAIRFVFVTPEIDDDICGDGGDDTANWNLQIDVVLGFKKGETAFQQLRQEVMAAIAALGAHYAWSGQREEFDADTKTNRCSLDYVVYQSS